MANAAGAQAIGKHLRLTAIAFDHFAQPAAP